MHALLGQLKINFLEKGILADFMVFDLQGNEKSILGGIIPNPYVLYNRSQWRSCDG